MSVTLILSNCGPEIGISSKIPLFESYYLHQRLSSGVLGTCVKYEQEISDNVQHSAPSASGCNAVLMVGSSGETVCLGIMYRSSVNY